MFKKSNGIQVQAYLVALLLFIFIISSAYVIIKAYRIQSLNEQLRTVRTAASGGAYNQNETKRISSMLREAVSEFKPRALSAYADGGPDIGLILYCGWLGDQIADGMTKNILIDEAGVDEIHADVSGLVGQFLGAGCSSVFGWAE